MEGILAPVGSFYAGCRVQFIQTEERILAGHKPARQKFLSALFATGKRGWKYLTLTMEESAAAIGETRERIQKALTLLEESGDIRVQPTYLRHVLRLSPGARDRDPSQLTASLARQPIFPAMMVRMVSAGESTGKIDNMLEKMADFWDEEIEATLNALTSLMEPILIVFLGAIVGGIVIAMFLPIFKLNDIVSGQK